MPTPTCNFFPELKKFVRNLLESRCVPQFPQDLDLSVNTWLNFTKYPLWRKQELLLENERLICLDDRRDPPKHVRGVKGELKNFGVGTFIKDETYPDYKHSRLINAGSDARKLFCGPLVRYMEKYTTDTEYFPEFVKHVPVSQRGKYVMDRLFREGHIYVATDYSSFESHFTRELMDAVEFTLYEYYAENCPKAKKIVNTMREFCLGTNELDASAYQGWVEATRMSGEMTTSLGNGFTNLCLMLFVCHKRNISNPVGVVEGDDGLFSFHQDNSPTTQDFTDLGCKIKLDTYERVSEASFCGLVFDETDQTVITDPLDILTSIGWANVSYHNSRYTKRNSLIRAKALSALYQYPACPIVSDLARFILRRTRSHDVRNIIEGKGLSMWERGQLRAASEAGKFWDVIQPIGLGTRQLVETLYGIPICDQLSIERQLREMHPDTNELYFEELESLIPESWKHYHDNYVLKDNSSTMTVEVLVAGHYDAEMRHRAIVHRRHDGPEVGPNTRLA